MEEGPSRNHGAFTREASLLNKKKMYLRAIRVHWEYAKPSILIISLSVDLAKDFEDVFVKKKEFQNA